MKLLMNAKNEYGVYQVRLGECADGTFLLKFYTDAGWFRSKLETRECAEKTAINICRIFGLTNRPDECGEIPESQNW